VRLILGLIKGAIVGAGLGFGFMQVGFGKLGFMQYLLYGLIGFLTGFIAGKPFWRHETIWTPVVKGLFGAAVAIGLYLLVAKVLGDPSLSFISPGASFTSLPYVLGGAIGALYGAFVEIDDGGEKEKSEMKPEPPAK
jgi:hypothetical protein